MPANITSSIAHLSSLVSSPRHCSANDEWLAQFEAEQAAAAATYRQSPSLPSAAAAAAAMNWQSADDATVDVESDASAEAEKAMRLVGSPQSLILQ